MTDFKVIDFHVHPVTQGFRKAMELLSLVFGIWMSLGVIGIAWAMVCDRIARAIILTLCWRQGKRKTMRVV